jgi:hypothetical protein
MKTKRRLTLLALIAPALAGCGSGTVTHTDTAPPHVLSVTVPVHPPAAASPAQAAPTVTALAPGPPAAAGKEPPGHIKKHDGKGRHGGGKSGD